MHLLSPCESRCDAAVELGGGTRLHFLSSPAPRAAAETASALREALRRREAEPLLAVLFGGERYLEAASAELRETVALRMPLRGDGCPAEEPKGTWQCVAVSGTKPEPLFDETGRIAGWRGETPAARWCLLGDLRPPIGGEPDAPAQARAVFETAERLLGTAGLAFTDTVRTWFYLRNLLTWYDAFNEVRTRFFEERGVFDRLVPASTGIGAAPPDGAALSAALFALRPLSGDLEVSAALDSPLQCPALDYRSSFSRAVEIRGGGRRFLSVSGTASIDAEGRSAHIGDCAAQIDLTLRVVEALLHSRDMSWENAVRAIAYFKHAEEMSLFAERLRRAGIPPFPVTLAHVAVCRDDLLFELELDAAEG